MFFIKTATSDGQVLQFFFLRFSPPPLPPRKLSQSLWQNLEKAITNILKYERDSRELSPKLLQLSHKIIIITVKSLMKLIKKQELPPPVLHLLFFKFHSRNHQTMTILRFFFFSWKRVSKIGKTPFLKLLVPLLIFCAFHGKKKEGEKEGGARKTKI